MIVKPFVIEFDSFISPFFFFDRVSFLETNKVRLFPVIAGPYPAGEPTFSCLVAIVLFFFFTEVLLSRLQWIDAENRSAMPIRWSLSGIFKQKNLIM